MPKDEFGGVIVEDEFGGIPVEEEAANADTLRLVEDSPARTLEELTQRNLSGQKALGTLPEAPKVPGIWDSSVPFPTIPGPNKAAPTVPEMAVAALQPGTAAFMGAFGPKVPVSVGRASLNLVPETWNFLTSPGGFSAAATAGLGAIPKAVVSAGFTWQMLNDLIKQGAETYVNWSDMKPEEKAEAIVGMAKTGGFTVASSLGLKSGLKEYFDKPRPPVIPPEPPPAIPPELPPIEPPIIPPEVKPVEPVAEPAAPAEVKSVEPELPTIVFTPEAFSEYKRAIAEKPPAAPAAETKVEPSERAAVPAVDIREPEQRRIPTYGEKYIAELGIEKARQRVDHLNRRTEEELQKRPVDRGAIKRLQQEAQNIANAIDAAETKGAPDATKERQVKESVLGERERTEAQRIPAETGVSDRVQPAASVGETPPPTLPNAPARESVLAEPPPKESLTVEPKGKTSPNIPSEFLHDRDFLLREKERILQDIDDWRSGKHATPGQPATSQNYQLVMRDEVRRLDERLKEVNDLLQEGPPVTATQPPSKTAEGKGEVTDVLASLNEDNPSGAVDALRSMKFADAKELLFRRLGIVDPRLDTSSKKNLIASFEKVAPEYTKSARQEKAKASRIRTLEREIQERTENLARHDQVVSEGGPDYAGLEVGVTREQAAQKIKDLQAELDKLKPTPPPSAPTPERTAVGKGEVEDIFTPARNWVVQQSDAVKGFLGSRMDAYDRWKSAKGATAKRKAKVVLDAADRELEQAKKVHHDAVEQAYNEGKTIPPDVLKDYPDLANLMPTKALATPVAKAQAKVAQVARTEGTRSAKEIKDELVQRLEEAATALIAKSGVVLDRLEDGRYRAQIPDSGIFAFGEIEKTKTGTFKVTAKRHNGESVTATFDTQQEAEWLIKALASQGNKTVKIHIPGDGDFNVLESGEAIVNTWRRAKQIQTKSEVGPTIPKPSQAKPSEESITQEAKDAARAYGSTENAYRAAKRQRDSLQEQEPPRTKEERDELSRQVDYAERLMRELYGETKAGILEARAEATRDRLASYREGAKSFEEAIAKIEKIKRKTAAHKERLEDLKERYAQNQKFLEENERNAEQWEQEAAREKMALEAPPPAAETGEKPIGMGGAVPSEFERTGGSPAATKFRMMDDARVKRGLEPLLKPQSVKDQAVLDRAMAEYDRDPAGAEVLADQLIKNPVPIQDWQNDYLLLRWIDTRDQFYRSAKEAAQADADGRMADMAAANGQTQRWSDAMTKLEQALRVGGSETGRALRARRVMINEDFSLAGLETQRRAALGGRALTPDERAELVKLADQYKATADALERDLATSKTRISQLEAQREIDRAIKETPLPYDKRILDYAESIVSRMETAAKSAKERILQRRREGRSYIGIDVEQLGDYALVGSAKLARGVKDFAAWSDSMVLELGDFIKNDLKQIWEVSNSLLEQTLKDAPEKVKTAVRKGMSVGERKNATEAQIQEKITKGKLNELQPVLRRYERILAEQGIRDRDVMIDAIHEFVSRLDPSFTRDMTMDAISGYGDFRPLTKGEIDVVIRDLHQQYQLVAKLRDMAMGVAPKRSGFERPILSEEGRRLTKQVEEAKRRGGYTVTDPERQLRTAMQAQKTRLENEISDLDHQIQTRQKIVKNRTRLQYDDEYNKLKAIRDEKKALFDEVFPKAPITEAQRLEAWNRHIDKRMAELQERIKNKDFSKKVRRPPPTLGPKELEKQDTMARLQEQFHELLLRDKYKNLHGAQKAYLLAKEGLNIPRNVMTSADVSAVLRQGGILSASHPIIAARALVPMFRGMASERMAGIIDQEILSRPNAKSGRYAQAKLYLAPLRSTTLSAMEEQIMSRFAHHIPLVRASNRAFITFLNRLRADAFDAFTDALEAKGAPLNEVELKAIGNYINITTGRGDLGARYNAGAELAATVLFSPRLVTSRFQFLAGQPLYRGSARTRALVAQEYGRSLTALAVFLGLGYIAGGTVELDPRSSDFGKLRFGNTRLDPMAGLSQSAVFLSRTSAAAANVLAETLANRKLLAGETKTVKGKVRMLGGPEVGYGQKDFADVVLTFLRSKFAPVPGSLIDILSRKNMVGEKVTPGDVLGTFKPFGETGIGKAIGSESEVPIPVPGTFLMPLSMQDVFNVMKEHGVAKGTALEILSLFGMGLQYFDTRQTRRK